MNRTIPLIVIVILGIWCSCNSPSEKAREITQEESSVARNQRQASATQKAQPQPVELHSFLQSFTAACCSAFEEESPRIVILPPISTQGTLTPCSDYLADEATRTFIDARAIVLERQHLNSLLDEIDIQAVFNGNGISTEIPSAHVLIVGRYSLVGGAFSLDLKAVEVSTSKVIVSLRSQLRTDRQIRQLAFTATPRREGSQDIHVEELAHSLRIKASYNEIGASELRLLDRVRQRIRRALSDYQDNAFGGSLTPDQLDDMFRRGSEVDCAFGRDSVTLEMEFGDTE
jgi:hypothetical protein